MILFTTHATARAAAASYRLRWPLESGFRDAQGGWEGRVGWDLGRTLGRVAEEGRVERVVGLWALGTLLQTWIGAATTATDVPLPVATEVAGWTATGRLSVWARGRLAPTDRRGRWHDRLGQTLAAGAATVAAAPPLHPHPVALPPASPARAAARGAATPPPTPARIAA